MGDLKVGLCLIFLLLCTTSTSYSLKEANSAINKLEARISALEDGLGEKSETEIKKDVKKQLTVE